MLQFAVVHQFIQLHVQAHGPVQVTAEALQELHNVSTLGSILKFCQLEDQHTQLIISKQLFHIWVNQLSQIIFGVVFSFIYA